MFTTRNASRKAQSFTPINGFTLLELLLVISISTLLFSIATPSFSSLIVSNRVESSFRELFSALQYTRSKAVFTSTTTIVCPTKDQKACTNEWTLPLMIFADKNDNQRRDNNEIIDRLITLPINNSVTIYWRAYGSNRYIRYYLDGTTKSQNGRITICPNNSSLVDARQIIIAKTGRPRLSRQSEIRQRDC